MHSEHYLCKQITTLYCLRGFTWYSLHTTVLIVCHAVEHHLNNRLKKEILV